MDERLRAGALILASVVWGDTVNTVSRMESRGVPGEIQHTGRAVAALHEAFEVELRGPIEVKGKGSMEALPAPDPGVSAHTVDPRIRR